MDMNDIKVGVVSIGYADGIPRNYKGRVFIKNTFAPIIGYINMDNLMINLSDIQDVEIGEDVYIWDDEHITLEEVSKKCNTITYEILSGIAPRVHREYVD